VKVEKAVWNPIQLGRGRPASLSLKAIRSLEVGKTVRIIHDDLSCGMVSYIGSGMIRSCSLARQVRVINQKGVKGFEQYYEGNHVMVVRRIK
jgi:hypothetical protein